MSLNSENLETFEAYMCLLTNTAVTLNLLREQYEQRLFPPPLNTSRGPGGGGWGDLSGVRETKTQIESAAQSCRQFSPHSGPPIKLRALQPWQIGYGVATLASTALYTGHTHTHTHTQTENVLTGNSRGGNRPVGLAAAYIYT